jgi:mRNA-degrading endonuclease RelE of RelBE toxin-antitoxin system
MVIIETPIFTKRIQGLISDEEYRLLQVHLVNRPDAGKTIVGSGGLRKLRWSACSHGKRGGIRVIYYWLLPRDTILFLYAYPKAEQDDLTPEQLRQLKKIVEKEYVWKRKYLRNSWKASSRAAL